jgi:hypothetical protein
MADAFPHRSAVFGRARLCHDSLGLSLHDSQGNVPYASVDAVKRPAGGPLGKENGVIIIKGWSWALGTPTANWPSILLRT